MTHYKNKPVNCARMLFYPPIYFLDLVRNEQWNGEEDLRWCLNGNEEYRNILKS